MPMLWAMFDGGLEDHRLGDCELRGHMAMAVVRDLLRSCCRDHHSWGCLGESVPTVTNVTCHRQRRRS